MTESVDIHRLSGKIDKKQEENCKKGLSVHQPNVGIQWKLTKIGDVK